MLRRGAGEKKIVSKIRGKVAEKKNCLAMASLRGRGKRYCKYIGERQGNG